MENRISQQYILMFDSYFWFLLYIFYLRTFIQVKYTVSTCKTPPTFAFPNKFCFGDQPFKVGLDINFSIHLFYTNNP